MTNRSTKPVGICRSHGVLGLPNGVLIRDADGAEKNIPEQRYRQNGYEPAFEALPWKMKYEVGSNGEIGNA
jgi:hypothetical protein